MPDIRQTANDRKTITAATFRRFSARAHYGMCGLPFAKRVSTGKTLAANTPTAQKVIDDAKLSDQG